MKIKLACTFLAISAVLFTVVAAIDSATIANTGVAVDSLLNLIAAVKGLNAGSVAAGVVLAAAINLLISIMKFKAVAAYLDTPAMKQVKPYIALVIGIAGGAGSTAITGQSLVAGMIMGALVGFSSTGIHETIKSLTGKNV
jgi:hypothetical protein